MNSNESYSRNTEISVMILLMLWYSCHDKLIIDTYLLIMTKKLILTPFLANLISELLVSCNRTKIIQFNFSIYTINLEVYWSNFLVYSTIYRLLYSELKKSIVYTMYLCDQVLPDLPMITPNERIYYIRNYRKRFCKWSCDISMKGNPSSRNQKKQNETNRIDLQSGDSQIWFFFLSRRI